MNQGYFLPVCLLDNEIYTTRGNSGLYSGLKMKNGSYSVKFNPVRAANGSRRFAKHISRSNTNFDKGCEQNGPKVLSFQYSLTSAAQGCLTWGVYLFLESLSFLCQIHEREGQTNKRMTWLTQFYHSVLGSYSFNKDFSFVSFSK